MNRMHQRPRQMHNNPSNTPAYNQVALDVSRVARVVKGGRRFRLRVLVVLGDKKGLVGVASAKGADYATAINKANDVARRKMKTMVIAHPTTIPHEVKAKVGGAQVLLKPAREGTGLIAGGVVRQVLEVAGYHNIYSKSLGNSNKTNVAYAVIKALEQLVAKEDWHIQRLRNSPKPVIQDAPVASSPEPATKDTPAASSPEPAVKAKAKTAAKTKTGSKAKAKTAAKPKV